MDQTKYQPTLEKYHQKHTKQSIKQPFENQVKNKPNKLYQPTKLKSG